MVEKVLLVLFWSWPVLLGLLVWRAKASDAVRYMDNLEAWLAATKARLKNSQSRVAHYWGRPTSVVALSPFRVTTPIGDPYLRAGTRVALVPYVAWAIIVGTMVVVTLAIALIAIFLALMLWGFISNLGKRSEEEDAYQAPPQPVSRVRGTHLVKTSFFGNTPTGTRMDETGRVMQEGFFGDIPRGVRVEDDGRILKEGFLGNVPTGFAINAEGQLVEEGFLGNTPTGTKIDEDGRVVKEGFFGDTPTGYEFKKE